ncbi:MAG: cyclic nucleotide-binding domain-containing protein [Deltaproteobacteria bacterium]|nr:cyclic nucleotide-binding domain-containing protein [Deltaproteobacteria bacterium]
MSTEARVHARTDVGRTREHNEDNFLCDRELGLFVVCDGMGGHAAGEVASRIAADALREHVRGVWGVVRGLEEGHPKVRPDQVKALLGAAVVAANAAVHGAADKDPALRGMGTTLTALLLVGGRAFLGHVGDSRAFLVRNGQARQLTEDHSVVNELRRRGRLKPEVLAKFPVKNAVTRAVGVYPTVEPDTACVLVAPGDRFVLCSDGLHRYAETEPEIAALAEGPSEEAITQRMVDYANSRGGQDNVTAVVLTLPDQPQKEAVVQALTQSYSALEALPFFRNLDHRELMQLQAIARARDVPEGARVVSEGEQDDSLFVLLKGQCVVTRGDHELGKIGPGEHFGEMALVQRSPRSATVLAQTPSRLVEITRGDLFRFLRTQKETGLKLLWNIIGVLTARLRRTNEQLGEAREQLKDEVTAEFLVGEDPDERSEERDRPTVPEDFRQTRPLGSLADLPHRPVVSLDRTSDPGQDGPADPVGAHAAYEAEPENPDGERDTLPSPPTGAAEEPVSVPSNPKVPDFGAS